MGFERVYDYEAGKKDWRSYGLPHEGTNVPTRQARDVACADVPTCTLVDSLATVRARVLATGWDTCIVVNDERVVLGRIGRRALAADTDESIEIAMTPGPRTVRPSIGAEALLERMVRQKLTSFVITTPDGRLVGLVRRQDLE
jgi:CBS domain-containing protein